MARAVTLDKPSPLLRPGLNPAPMILAGLAGIIPAGAVLRSPAHPDREQDIGAVPHSTVGRRDSVALQESHNLCTIGGSSGLAWWVNYRYPEERILAG